MLIHPQFDPVAFKIGPLAVRWYGLMYLVGFLGGAWLGKVRVRRHPWLGWTVEQVDEFLTFVVLGVILGGRLGYVLFYKPMYFLAHPLEIPQTWEGGMAFHGGLLGVTLACAWFARRHNKRWFDVTDFVAPCVSVGLGAGRIGNFINGELPGRITSVPWGMWFPQADANPVLRHPSQLYEALLEGPVLLAVLWWFARRPQPRGLLSGVFLIAYGAIRFGLEFTRQPDDFLGILAFGMSMGQWLSLPMVLGGIALIAWSRRREA
ncbi:MAG: prolipoprotein diacylglyceryl transferase [Pseudomonadota bacterium]|nr:prolipoprotein diacylglyceryl transferase [Pseudomonadota bacterium]